jgi:drug/metabolite transporter (DMT)-like permease
VVGGAVAAAGLWLLSGEIAGGLRKGDPYIIACAALWALHVVLTGVLAPKASPLRLAAVQFGLVALVSASLALPLEADRFMPTGEGLVALAYSGVLVIGVAFTLQIVAQRHAPPTHAAVLMSTEAVFAAAFGVLLLSERLTGPESIGCALMLAGCVLSQTLPHRRTRTERAALVKPVR